MSIEAKLALFAALMLLTLTPQWNRIMRRLFPYDLQVSYNSLTGLRVHLVHKQGDGGSVF